MSRVGKLPVIIPDNIKVSLDGDIINFDSGKVKKSYKVSSGVKVELTDKEIKLSATDKSIPKISMFVGMSLPANPWAAVQISFHHNTEFNLRKWDA